jgi:nucleotide-binding universal stress UspA family protein
VERFVVGLDGSEPSRRALEFALRHANYVTAVVYLLHVRSLPGGPAGGAMSETLDALEQQARAMAESVYRRKLAAHDVIIRSGPPVEALLTVASELPADLLVVGTSGVGHHGTGALGSTAAQLVVRSRLPVVVVP